MTSMTHDAPEITGGVEREPPGEFRDEILQRVVAARSMAREGLSETRQALSALRGE